MSRHLPVILLSLIVIAFRVLGAMFPDTLPNFQPLPALILCSFIFLKGTQRWILPLCLWLLTDPLVSLLQGYPVFGPHHVGILLGLASVVAISRLFKSDSHSGQILLGSLSAAVSFYLLTNTLSFLTLPLYPKTLAGFVQAQWTGPAGFAPTWLFLRNLVGANLLFTVLFLVAIRPLGLSLLSQKTAKA